MKKIVQKSQNALGFYVDKDVWFIIPVLAVVIAYMIWRAHHG